ANTARSQAVVYTWNTDTSTAFDVFISGTGLWTGTLASPNGFWAVGAHAWFANDYPSPGMCAISNGGDRTTYLGTINGFIKPFQTLQGYADWFPQSATVHDGASFLNSGGFPTTFWKGTGLITVTSMPNKSDVSTWTWTEEVSGHLVIPEPSTLSLS